MASPPVPTRLRRARLAVGALFLVNGALLAGILPRLPAIKAGLGLSNAELGAAVAAMPIGGLIAGGLAGVIIGRAGSGRVTVATGVASAVLVVTLGLAPSWAVLAAAFLVVGALDAIMDASMNAHGIAVQARYGRSILHAFHGWWSAGTLVGAAAGAIAAGAGVPVPAHLAVAGTALAGVALIASRGLLAPDEVDATPRLAGEGAEWIHVRNAPRLLRILGPLALLGVLGVMLEDAAQTWSAVYLHEVLRVGAGPAAGAFVMYTAAMTIGRLTNDRWVDRWGGVTVAATGALIAAGGLGLVMAAGVAGASPLAYAGFAAVGIGAASLFPVMIDRAAARPGLPPAHGIAIVSWLARVGFVIAPLSVGLAADAAGLAAAFVVPLVAALAIVALAPTLLAARAGADPAHPRP